MKDSKIYTYRLNERVVVLNVRVVLTSSTGERSDKRVHSWLLSWKHHCPGYQGRQLQARSGSTFLPCLHRARAEDHLTPGFSSIVLFHLLFTTLLIFALNGNMSIYIMSYCIIYFLHIYYLLFFCNCFKLIYAFINLLQSVLLIALLFVALFSRCGVEVFVTTWLIVHVWSVEERPGCAHDRRFTSCVHAAEVSGTSAAVSPDVQVGCWPRAGWWGDWHQASGWRGERASWQSCIDWTAHWSGFIAPCRLFSELRQQELPPLSPHWLCFPIHNFLLSWIQRLSNPVLYQPNGCKPVA